MLAVVQELAARYAQHRSLAGLALRLSAYGYAQLPGPDWGMDDTTIARFEHDARLQVPGEGPERFAARAAFLAAEPQRAAWLRWRADQLHRFYCRAQETWLRPGPAQLDFGRRRMAFRRGDRGRIAARAPRASNLVESLLNTGIYLRQYQADPRLVLLRPERIVPAQRLNAQAVDLEIGQLPDTDAAFAGLPQPGSLFFHPPQEVRIASFDEQSPFKSTYTWLVTHATPSGGAEPATLHP